MSILNTDGDACNISREDELKELPFRFTHAAHHLQMNLLGGNNVPRQSTQLAEQIAPQVVFADTDRVVRQAPGFWYEYENNRKRKRKEMIDSRKKPIKSGVLSFVEPDEPHESDKKQPPKQTKEQTKTPNKKSKFEAPSINNPGRLFGVCSLFRSVLF
jgi:hypothetical protein